MLPTVALAGDSPTSCSPACHPDQRGVLHARDYLGSRTGDARHRVPPVIVGEPRTPVDARGVYWLCGSRSYFFCGSSGVMRWSRAS